MLISDWNVILLNFGWATYHLRYCFRKCSYKKFHLKIHSNILDYAHILLQLLDNESQHFTWRMDRIMILFWGSITPFFEHYKHWLIEHEVAYNSTELWVALYRFLLFIIIYVKLWFFKLSCWKLFFQFLLTCQSYVSLQLHFLIAWDIFMTQSFYVHQTSLIDHGGFSAFIKKLLQSALYVTFFMTVILVFATDEVRSFNFAAAIIVTKLIPQNVFINTIFFLSASVYEVTFAQSQIS